ncbi:putative surface protease GP63, partial [Trypanosoma cruzi]
YSMAETLWWGNNSGCEPLEKKCLIEGTTDHPDLFCNQFPDEDHMLYTHDRLSLGSRNVKMYDELLPVEHRHFVNTNLGGAFDFMDRCPIVEAYANTGCKNGMSSVMPGSFIGPNSRCVKGKHLQFDDKHVGDLCVNTQCNDDTLSVQFFLDDTWHVCREGETVAPRGEHWSGGIGCTRYADACTVLPNSSAYLIPVVDPPLTDAPKFPEDAGEEVMDGGSISRLNPGEPLAGKCISGRKKASLPSPTSALMGDGHNNFRTARRAADALNRGFLLSRPPHGSVGFSRGQDRGNESLCIYSPL